MRREEKQCNYPEKLFFESLNLTTDCGVMNCQRLQNDMTPKLLSVCQLKIFSSVVVIFSLRERFFSSLTALIRSISTKISAKKKSIFFLLLILKNESKSYASCDSHI